MSDRVEVVSLGVEWVRHLKAQARQALRDFPVWIGLGTAITVGAVLICPWTPTGIGVLTFAMVLMLGALSWRSRPDRAAPPPTFFAMPSFRFRAVSRRYPARLFSELPNRDTRLPMLR